MARPRKPAKTDDKKSTTRKKRKKKGSVVSIDFTDTDSSVLLPEDEYVCEVISVTHEEEDTPYLLWKFITEHEEDALNGKTIRVKTFLTKAALWKVAGLLETLGVEVPRKSLDIDLSELPGLKCILDVIIDEYENNDGKTVKKNEADAFIPYVEEKKDKKKPKKKKGKKDEEPEEEDVPEVEDDTKDGDDDDNEEGEVITEDEVKNMSSDELDEVISEFDLTIPPRSQKTTAKKRSAVIAALEEAGELE